MPDIKFEIKRKLFHLTSILLIPIYYFAALYLGKLFAISIFGTILTFFLLIEVARAITKKNIPIFGCLYRENEKIGTTVYILLGASIAFAFFDFNVASTAILMATFGDMAAAIVGISCGKHWLKFIKNCAWEGIIAEFLVDFVIAIIILRNIPVAIIMSLVATFVETVFTKIDDNLSVPILAGLTGHLLLKVI
jgi:dolichol kinase|tara:strand:+ start:705 stop:1283 length:579 start_codon:yes stop_codon:yes gene_type:complete